MLMQRIVKDDGIPTTRVEEIRRYLAQVVSETARVGRIVQDLLAFSRRQKPQRTSVNLNAMVGRTVNLISHKLKLMSVEVELRLDEHLPPVHADGSQIQQVLINLIMNAAEAAQNRPPGRIVVTSSLEANDIVLKVHDNGDGIPEEIRSKIFEPFFTTKGEGKGVGLGLAVVYGIVDAHKGNIDVESAPGGGNDLHSNASHPDRSRCRAAEGGRSPRGGSGIICILPMGEIGRDILVVLQAGLWRSFGYEVGILDPLPVPGNAYDIRRQQFNSVVVLRDVAGRVPAKAVKVLAVTGVDLFIPMLSFVFGQAQFGGSAALISLARLQQEFYGIPPNPGLTTTRAVKECIHEVGHTFGLIHCPDPGCPMSLSNNVRQVDVKSDEFCSNCSIILEEHITSIRRERVPAGERETHR